MKISEFIEATNASSDPAHVFSLFLLAMADLGLDRVMYSVLTKSDRNGAVDSPAIMRNYPDDWIRYYVAKGYVETDPVRRMCIVARRPFAWSEVEASEYFPKKNLRIFPEAHEAGLKDGVAVPLHGPCGEVMGVGLASSTGGVEPLKLLNKINIFAVQFHTIYSSLSLPEERPTPIHLTEREKEILQWCLAGKSNWVIGEILGLAERTVEWHLTNIFTKLGTATRLAAVVKALHLGLISA